MGQLEQLLGYLERDGVTEVVLGVGRPIAMRTTKGLTNLTARPLTIEQLISVTRGTPIGAMIGEAEAGTDTDEPVEVRIGARRAHVAVTGRGGELTLRLVRADAGSAHADDAASHSDGHASRRDSGAPHGHGAVSRPKPTTNTPTKPTTISPRAKSPTGARAKSPTNAPHAKSPSEPRAKSSTNSRAKSPRDSPRVKTKTVPPHDRANTPPHDRANTPTGSARAKSPTYSPRAKSPTYTRAKTLTGTPSGLLPSLADLPPSRAVDPRLEGLATRPPAVDPRLEGLATRPPAVDPRIEGLRASADPRLEGHPPRASADPRLEGHPPRASADPRLEGLPNREAIGDPRLAGLPTRGATTDARLEGLPTRGATTPSSVAAASTMSTMSTPSAPNRATMTMPSSSRGPATVDPMSYDEGLDIGFVRSPASDAATGMPGFDDRPPPVRLGSLSADLGDDDDIDDLPSIRSHASNAAAAISSTKSMRLGFSDGELSKRSATAGGPTGARPSHQAMSLDLDDGTPDYAREAGAQVAEPMSLDLEDLRGPIAGAPFAPVGQPAMSAHVVAPSTSQRVTPVATPAFAALVKEARDRRASDLHVSAGRVTSVRVGVDLVPLEPGAPSLTAREAEALLAPLIDGALRAQLESVGYVDFALEAPGGGRLRANICRQQQGLKGTFRLALPAPVPLDALGLPAELAKVVGHHQGLVVIAGPSGHGKTTTLAALVDLVNSTKPHHILTIEDPIELVHVRKQAVISQREVGRDTVSFARGLKASLREDPDVIVIGELRDRESVEIALTAAETGHLVLATMSTPSAAKTIDRLVDMFPPEEHSQVRASVAGALRAIVAQRLLPKKGGGVVPAIELVTGVLPLAVLIREDKLYQLPNLMQRGRAFGMIRFDESLIELVRTGKIDEDTALAYAESRKDFASQLQAKTAVMWKVPPK